MMSQQTTTTIPRDLQSSQAKLVYLYLSTHGETTLTQLQDALDMKKLSLYSILKTLTDRDLVVQTRERYALAR